MRVITDEPGRRLVIEGQPPQLPGGLIGGLVGGLIAAAGAAVSTQLWRPSRVRADREAGVLEMVEVNGLSGETRRDEVALSRIRSVNVRSRFWRKASEKRQPATPGSSGFDLNVLLDESGSHALVMEVDGIDTREKIADFAARLGAVLGLSHRRAVQWDPRRIELEFLPTSGPQTTSAGEPFSRSLPEEIIPRFDPGRFQGDFRVTTWKPGEEVLFEKPLGKGLAFGCLPFVLAGLLIGPAMLSIAADRILTIFMTVFGLIVAFVAGALVVAGLPKRTRIAWSERVITVAGLGGFGRRQIPFDRLAAIELRCVRSYSGSSRHSYNDYRCDILAHERGNARPIELLSTERFKEDPEQPYDQALPLVTELSRSLSVERRVSEYD